jgi:putative flippase GtrA
MIRAMLLEGGGGTMGQLVRYALTGGAITALGAGAYAALVAFTALDPMLAVAVAYVICVAVGYVLHSRWSFQGHGAGDNPKTTARFFAVSLVSYALNSLFTWVLTKWLHGPDWWPIVPMLFVTPLATFALNRRWVFS